MLSVTVELDLDGSGAYATDITAYTRVGEGISINRGRRSEQGSPSPASLNLAVNNAAGRFSPRNPSGPYYGQLGRNTPIRVTATSGVGTGASVRFTGEVASWPPEWDKSGHVAWVNLTASGIRRRLSQGQTPLLDPLDRKITRLGDLVAYWPMEDPPGSAIFASRSAAAPALDAGFGAGIDFAADTTHFPTVGGLAIFTGGSAGASFGPVAGTDYQARMLVYVPSGLVPVTPAVSFNLLRLNFTGGDVGYLSLEVVSGTGSVPPDGQLQWAAFTPASVSIPTGIGLVDAILDRAVLLSAAAKQNGANIDLRLDVITLAGVAVTYTATLVAKTLGTLTGVAIGLPRAPFNSPLAGVSFGGLVIQDAWTSTSELTDALAGYPGELAEDRIERLCTEEGVPYTLLGGITGASEPLGPQRPATLLALLDESALADGGILTEDREAIGFVYTPRVALYNQGAAATLDYSARHLEEFSPTEDDAALVNDLTITRPDGSSARYELTTGALSTQPPPGGVGRYDSAYELNLAGDDQLAPAAAWRVRVGTIDEPRYPGIGVDLLRGTDKFTTGQQDDLLGVLEGDLLAVLAPPVLGGAPDDLSQLVAGYTEFLHPALYRLVFTGIPATPYNTGEYDQNTVTLARYSPTTCVLNEALDATEIGIDVTTTPPWTTTGGSYPFDVNIGGERIRVAGITGTGANQTFTGCTRSVNGVAKTHLAGAPVALWTPARYAL